MKAKKRIRTTIRRYDLLQTSPHNDTSIRSKISPKKIKISQSKHGTSYEKSTIQQNRKKQEDLVQEKNSPITAYPRMSNVVQEPEHRKKKLCMVHIP